MPSDVVKGITPDPDDDYLPGVAFRGRADVLVSGDRHLLGLGAIKDGEGEILFRILAPRQFLEELEQAG